FLTLTCRLHPLHSFPTRRSSDLLNPADAPTANNLALLLKQQNRFSEAAGVLATALSASPDVADLHYNLAVISELYLLDLPSALRSEEHTSELQSRENLVCRLLLE